MKRSDFYPKDMTQEAVDALLAGARKAIIKQATAELNTRANDTKPFYLVHRNETGSVAVPDAIKENEAVNKKILDETEEKTIKLSNG